MFQFGDFLFDEIELRLLKAENMKEVVVEPKLIELLQLFIERPYATLTRQDILDEIWAGSVVTDNAINKLIANLRKVLQDQAKNPRYIQTVPKRGYRLVCRVEVISDSNLLQAVSKRSDVHAMSLSSHVEPKKRVSNYVIYSSFFICVSLLSLIIWQFNMSDRKSTRLNSSH